VRVLRALEFAPEEGEEDRDQENIALLRRMAMDEVIASEDTDLDEADRSSMIVMLEMTHTEFSPRDSRAGL
jgi:hypothetical protein